MTELSIRTIEMYCLYLFSFQTEKAVLFTVMALSVCSLAVSMPTKPSSRFFLSLGAGKYLALLADGSVGLSTGSNCK